MKPRFLRLRFFVWIIPAGVLLVAAELLGSPHVMWSYSWPAGTDSKGGYTSCTYLGFDGPKTVHAMDGACAWVRFFTSEKRS